MRKKKEYIQGVANITKRINSPLKNLGVNQVVDENTVRRHLLDGTMPSEPRSHPKEPYRTDVNSFPTIDPNVNLSGFGAIADYLGVSSRQALRGIKEGKTPVDWLFGRVYSCQTSLDLIKKR